MKGLLKPFVTFTQCIVFLFLGCIGWLFLCLYCMVHLPAILYRYIVSQWVVQCFYPELSSVTVRNAGIATDFLPNYNEFSSRNGVVATFVFEGTMCFNTMREKIKNLLQETDSTGKLLYPEFTHCIDSWLGFMFWAQEPHLDGHINYHNLAERSSDEECENFVSTLSEQLLNRTFKIWKSPWELHLVHEYKNQILHNGPMTVLILDFHRVMTERPYFARDLSGVKPKSLPNSTKESSFHIIEGVKFPVRFLFDMGMLLFYFMLRQNTTWLVKDKAKTLDQMYTRSALVPVKKINQIKNKLGTSFDSVLLSSVASAIGQAMKRSSLTASQVKQVDSLLIGVSITSFSHPPDYHNINTVLDVPCSTSMDSIDRLRLCDNLLKRIKHSTTPTILNLLKNLFQSHVAPIARFFAENRICPVCLHITNLSDIDFDCDANNRLLGGDLAYGGGIGDAGVTFTISVSKDYLRIIATAEAAVMGTGELFKLVDNVETEIDKLNSLS